MRRSFTRMATIMAGMTVLAMTSGVFATWNYAAPLTNMDNPAALGINEFQYEPDMPEGEVTLLNRLYAILNRLYTTPLVQDARTYLLEETIKVQWETGAAPYVGSMDPDFAFQINELFGDVLAANPVSFILKNQDLNYDGFNEIAMYSTSDPLDYVETGYLGIVGVYVSVFTPVVDEYKNIIGYEMVCDSMYGFCNEVHYNPNDPNESSFSTDDWRDNLTYWHHELGDQFVPDDAIAIDGVSLFKYHYESYHARDYLYEGAIWGAMKVWVNGYTAAQKLAGKIPWIG